eukprot:TRINITY_DN197_c0_g1_i1.p1 TRINITY_DN197_c0_g1~~TRINITY_DN197_c0_g1_i1.p1  ORF type:complete len:789 (-),score=204.06 TRINITY_DN197_c0_g1_i1:29-2395(-)
MDLEIIEGLYTHSGLLKHTQKRNEIFNYLFDIGSSDTHMQDSSSLLSKVSDVENFFDEISIETKIFTQIPNFNYYLWLFSFRPEVKHERYICIIWDESFETTDKNRVLLQKEVEVSSQTKFLNKVCFCENGSLVVFGTTSGFKFFKLSICGNRLSFDIVQTLNIFSGDIITFDISQNTGLLYQDAVHKPYLIAVGKVIDGNDMLLFSYQRSDGIFVEPLTLSFDVGEKAYRIYDVAFSPISAEISIQTEDSVLLIHVECLKDLLMEGNRVLTELTPFKTLLHGKTPFTTGPLAFAVGELYFREEFSSLSWAPDGTILAVGGLSLCHDEGNSSICVLLQRPKDQQLRWNNFFFAGFKGIVSTVRFYPSLFTIKTNSNTIRKKQHLGKFTAIIFIGTSEGELALFSTLEKAPIYLTNVSDMDRIICVGLDYTCPRFFSFLRKGIIISGVAPKKNSFKSIGKKEKEALINEIKTYFDSFSLKKSIYPKASTTEFFFSIKHHSGVGSFNFCEISSHNNWKRHLYGRNVRVFQGKFIYIVSTNGDIFIFDQQSIQIFPSFNIGGNVILFHADRGNSSEEYITCYLDTKELCILTVSYFSSIIKPVITFRENIEGFCCFSDDSLSSKIRYPIGCRALESQRPIIFLSDNSSYMYENSLNLWISVSDEYSMTNNIAVSSLIGNNIERKLMEQRCEFFNRETIDYNINSAPTVMKIETFCNDIERELLFLQLFQKKEYSVRPLVNLVDSYLELLANVEIDDKKKYLSALKNRLSDHPRVFIELQKLSKKISDSFFY